MKARKPIQKDGKCPVCNMELKAVKASAHTAPYQCPMKCEGDKTYAKAGKCPVCNMDLKDLHTKKTDEDHKGHNHD